jgi:hypothetical protein
MRQRLRPRLTELVLYPVRDGTVRRFLFAAAVAFWLGGFTFYSAVVIHVGHRVLGSQLKQGFVTQRVTNWLNLAGALALLVMLWNARAVWRERGRLGRLGRLGRFVLAGTWVLMAAVQVELFVLHPAMDALLDTAARVVLDDPAFRRLHFVYLMSSTAQWAAGLLHVWCVAAAAGPAPRPIGGAGATAEAAQA